MSQGGEKSQIFRNFHDKHKAILDTKIKFQLFFYTPCQTAQEIDQMK